MQSYWVVLGVQVGSCPLLGSKLFFMFVGSEAGLADSLTDVDGWVTRESDLVFTIIEVHL